MSTGDRLRSQVAQDSSPFAFLAAHHLFGVLPPEELRSLVAEVAERRYRKGHHVFFPGDVPSQVYVVKQGLISLTKGDEHGTERVLLTYGCGDVFGAVVAVLDRPYAYIATALVDSELFVLRATTFKYLHHRYPEVAVETLRQSYKASLALQQMIFHLSVKPLTARLAAFLLKSATESATPGSGTLQVKLGLSHQDLALLMATTRVSVTRVFTRLSRASVIAVSGRHVLILKPDVLQRLAGD